MMNLSPTNTNEADLTVANKIIRQNTLGNQIIEEIQENSTSEEDSTSSLGSECNNKSPKKDEVKHDNADL